MHTRNGLTTEDQINEMRQELFELKYRKNSKKVFRKNMIRVSSFILTLVLLLTLLGSILHKKMIGQIPDVFGYYLFEVESGSMSPTLSVGDIFVAKKPSSTDNLDIGTIVTYYNTDGAIVTHRITGIIKDSENEISYQTKGDNIRNSTDLETLSQDRIISVYCFTVKRARP